VRQKISFMLVSVKGKIIEPFSLTLQHRLFYATRNDRAGPGVHSTSEGSETVELMFRQSATWRSLTVT
jgi:hypothetical protein